MADFCVVCGLTTENDEAELFRFPEDKELFCKWLEVCAVLEEEIDKNSKICSKHFICTDFTSNSPKKELSPTAIPSVFEEIPYEIEELKTRAESPISKSVSSTEEVASLVTFFHSYCSLEPLGAKKQEVLNYIPELKRKLSNDSISSTEGCLAPAPSIGKVRLVEEG